MKAIILAAGMGTRLGRYTQDMPKCMLKFLGQTLLDRQIATLRRCGLTDIVVVTGYKKEKIKAEGVKLYDNPEYATTNMVETLFAAAPELEGELLIAYSDVVCEERVVRKAMESGADIGVTADEDYMEYWRARLDHPEDDMESLVIESGKVVELGAPCGPEKAKVRYVGLIKLSAAGTESLKAVYAENKKRFYDSPLPWHQSKSFRKGYMTSLLEAAIKAGHRVEPIIIKRGWLEFDTVEDYERATSWAKDGSLKRFINLT